MDKLTKEAVIASIAHWRDNRYAIDYDDVSIDADDCALCRIYNDNENIFNDDCTGCPIREKTKLSACKGTPYGRAWEYLGEWGTLINIGTADRIEYAREQFQKAAQDMVDFLIELLSGREKRLQRQLDNRYKWAHFLMEPERKKAVGGLESMVDLEARCCLGHACAMLGVERSNDMSSIRYGHEQTATVAPQEVIDALGLHGASGGFKKIIKEADLGFRLSGTATEGNVCGIISLASLNDRTTATPQQIGKFILDNIDNPDFWVME